MSLEVSVHLLFFLCLFSKLLSFLSFENFSHQRLLMVFHWSLRESKSHQVYRTLISTFPTQQCLILNSFCASLWHSLIMRSIVLSLSPHNLRERRRHRGVTVDCGGVTIDCGIVVSEFVLQLRYYVHFRTNIPGKGMNPLILPAMG